MERSTRAGLILLGGAVVLGAGLLLRIVLGEAPAAVLGLGVAGALLVGAGAWGLRAELGALLDRRRWAIAAHTAGVVGIALALAYLAALHPLRFDLTESGRFSLSAATVAMLERLERPVDIVFFHDPMMRETVELYELIARQTPKVRLELYDAMLQPARARLHGVEFAGTAVLRSDGRELRVHGGNEVDIANGILRVSRSATQRVCFVDGHGEPDPFSLESHDHLEGAPGHRHGLGVQYVLHERHGMAKARHALETLNYAVEKVALSRGGDVLAGCALVVVAGPKVPLLAGEVARLARYLAAGGHGLFLLDPFVRTGLEPVLEAYGIRVEDDIVIDEASHFWADPSSPAVSDYNRHQITRDVPLAFFPGARSLSPTARRPPGTSVVPLVNTSRRSWGQQERARLDATAARERPGPRTLMAVALRRPPDPVADDPIRREPAAAPPAPAVPPATRPSRVVVAGDSDFATNSFFHVMGNGTLFLNIVNYLAGQENLIGLTPRGHDLPRVNLTNRQVKATFVLAVVLVPALLALVGTAMWWRQR
jgi:ABC-type uncharacterized transport system involved in gliding motility auxiliary subunit